MAVFIAKTSRGLGEALASELKDLGLKVVKSYAHQVFFEGSWEDCYRANLYSRIASRIVKPLLEFVAYQPEELYGHIKKHDFTKYIDVHQTLAIVGSVTDCKLNDQRLVALKTKDSIVDQFRDKFGERPSVDKDQPALKVYIDGYKNRFWVNLDTSGDSLFMREYRKEAGMAPVKENVAAGLIGLSEWDGTKPIVDLMCGSGTFLIEGAMKAMKIAPGTLRKGFAFQKFKNYEPEIWDRLVNEAINSELEELPWNFYGYDSDPHVLKKARRNAERAGVEGVIQFSKVPITTATPPCPEGCIVVNPPYGARMGEEELLRDTYRDLGHTLKSQFQGWTCWVLSGNKDLIIDMKLKASRKHFVYNGSLECRFLRYDMY